MLGTVPNTLIKNSTPITRGQRKKREGGVPVSKISKHPTSSGKFLGFVTSGKKSFLIEAKLTDK